mgnify:CR=1 FL=1
MTLRAYQKAQAAAENPRNAEYRLFGQVTGALIDASSSGAKGTALSKAVCSVAAGRPTDSQLTPKYPIRYSVNPASERQSRSFLK